MKYGVEAEGLLLPLFSQKRWGRKAAQICPESVKALPAPEAGEVFVV
jgi:hypothetical protein